MAKPLLKKGTTSKRSNWFRPNDSILFLVAFSVLHLYQVFCTGILLYVWTLDLRLFEESWALKGIYDFPLFNLAITFWTPFSLLWKFTVIAFLFWFRGIYDRPTKVPYRELWHLLWFQKSSSYYLNYSSLWCFWLLIRGATSWRESMIPGFFWWATSTRSVSRKYRKSNITMPLPRL